MTAATPHVTVVIPTFQRDPYLRALLQQLTASSYPAFDVLIVDQTGVHDEATQEQFAQLGARLRVIAQPPRGLIQALRTGLREARGDLLLFLDDDIVIAPDLLERHAANYQDPRIGAVGGLVLPPGAQPEERLHWLFRRRAGLRPYFFSHAYGHRAEVAVAPGGNMSFRRDALAGPESLDPNLCMHHSEIDLCQGVMARGWRVVHDPTARVIHLAAPGGTRQGTGISQEIFTDCHYLFRKYHRGLDLAVLRAQLFWHRVVRMGVAEPALAPRHFWRYMRGLRAARALLGHTRRPGGADR